MHTLTSPLGNAESVHAGSSDRRPAYLPKAWEDSEASSVLTYRTTAQSHSSLVHPDPIVFPRVPLASLKYQRATYLDHV